MAERPSFPHTGLLLSLGDQQTKYLFSRNSHPQFALNIVSSSWSTCWEKQWATGLWVTKPTQVPLPEPPPLIAYGSYISHDPALLGVGNWNRTPSPRTYHFSQRLRLCFFGIVGPTMQKVSPLQSAPPSVCTDFVSFLCPRDIPQYHPLSLISHELRMISHFTLGLHFVSRPL